jgi:hypothetical protein
MIVSEQLARAGQFTGAGVDDILCRKSFLFPMNAFHRAGLDGLFNAILLASFRQSDLRFLFGFVERKGFRANLYTGLTAGAFFHVDHKFSAHSSLLPSCGRFGWPHCGLRWHG